MPILITGLFAPSGGTDAFDLLSWHDCANHNWNASAAPTVNDDSNAGYVVGSLWLDTTNDKAYIAVDVTVGAAIWKQITPGYTETTIVLFLDGAQTVGTKKKNWNFYVPWTNGATIKKAILKANTGPTGAALIVDINKNGTTMYTTQANRPTIAYNDGDSKVDATLPDVVTIAAGDIITLDIDQKETGTPKDLIVMIQGA